MKKDNLDEYKRSPLHYVCIDNEKEEWASITKKLINEGYNVNEEDNGGWTPLHFAAQAGGRDVAEILIESGANISAKDENGNTPLWVATMNSYNGLELINLLLKNGADPNEKNIQDISPMDLEPGLFK
jgi:ankyrin repeat protein